MDDEPAPTVERLVGVYHAEGTVRGELAYWVGARLGRAHCALCDITHGTFRMRDDWQACRDSLLVPFDTFHLDDQPSGLRPLTEGRTPCVVALTATGPRLLLGPDDLDACGGEVDRFADALERSVAAAGLAWPPEPAP